MTTQSNLVSARSRDFPSEEQFHIGEIFRGNAKPIAAVLAASNIAQVQAPRLAENDEATTQAMRNQSSPSTLVSFYDACLRIDPKGGKDALRPSWLDAAAQRDDKDQADLMRMSGNTDVPRLVEILTQEPHIPT